MRVFLIMLTEKKFKKIISCYGMVYENEASGKYMRPDNTEFYNPS